MSQRDHSIATRDLSSDEILDRINREKPIDLFVGNRNAGQKVTDSQVQSIEPYLDAKSMHFNRGQLTVRGIYHLSKFTGLETLTIAGSRFDFRSMTAFENFQSLKHLSLQGLLPEFDSIVQSDHIHCISKLRDLEGLSLCITDLNEIDLKPLASLSNLTHLSLRFVNSGSASKLPTGFRGNGFNCLHSMPHLKTLSFWGLGLTDDSFSHLPKFKNLEVLILHCIPGRDWNGSGFRHIQPDDGLRVFTPGSLTLTEEAARNFPILSANSKTYCTILDYESNALPYLATKNITNLSIERQYPDGNAQCLDEEAVDGILQIRSLSYLCADLKSEHERLLHTRVPDLKVLNTVGKSKLDLSFDRQSE